MVFSWEDVTESTPMMLQVDEDNDLIVKAEIANNYNHGSQDQTGLRRIQKEVDIPS